MLVNPISFRLSSSLYWNSTWNIFNNENYKYLFYSDLVFFEFFIFFFRKVLKIKQLDIYSSHIRLLRQWDKIIINLYYHVSYERYFNDLVFLCKEKKKNEYVKDYIRNKKNLYLKKENSNVKKIIIKITNYINYLLKKDLNNKKNWQKITYYIEKHVDKKKYKKFFVFLKKNVKKIFIKISTIFLYLKSLKKIKLLQKKKLILIKKKEKHEYVQKYINILKKKKEKNKIIDKKINELTLNIKSIFTKNILYKKIKKIKNKENLFLYKINFLKFIYNQKILIYNLYYYFISKFLKLESKNLFNKYFKKIKLNIYKINAGLVSAAIISKYIKISLKRKYSIYETMRPILADLQNRIRIKRLKGFKVVVSGRFKRDERATYWWKQNGAILTGTTTAAIDYSVNLLRTKYGVSTLSVWLVEGDKGLHELSLDYPSILPFFFLIKKNFKYNINYILLKKNTFFFNKILKKNNENLNKNYFKIIIMDILYKYIYINIFLKNILLLTNNFTIQKIFLPQYFIYKISLNDYLNKNYIKIIPFIQVKLLKRINIRHSYKIKKNIKSMKYQILLN